MYDIVGGLGVGMGLFYLAFKGESDRKKIEESFKNTGYGVKDFHPWLLRTIRKKEYIEYIFNVPYGLTDDSPKLKNLEKTLHKPVHIYFDGKLHIRVYKRHLPTKVQYDWQRTKPWQIPIGETYEGSVYHSFDVIPHMTIAGMTRQGKTVLLKLIFGHLIHQHPHDVQFHIIDLKGGLEFNRYRKLKQVSSIASDVYETHRTLSSIYKRMRDDMSAFKEKDYTNILDTPLKRRTFVIVDEGAELTPQSHHSKEEKAIYNECREILSHIARIGGALGYRLVYCSQYPLKENMPAQIKQNADAKISFRLPTEIASRVAIDEGGAQEISHVGRAIYRTATKTLMQVPYVADKELYEKVKEWECATDREEVSPARENPTSLG